MPAIRVEVRLTWMETPTMESNSASRDHTRSRADARLSIKKSMVAILGQIAQVEG
jgi:hypothetical protein